MSSVTSEVTVPQIGRGRTIGFYAAAGLFVALFVVLYGFVIGILQYPVTGWFQPQELTIHQFHDTVGVFLIYVVVGGMLIQLFRPKTQVGGMQQASLLTIVVVATMVAGGSFQPPTVIFLALAVITAVLHPAREQVFSVRHLDPALLALVAVAALPLLDYGLDQVTLQRVAGDAHAEIGHYATMGAYGFATLVLGLLASLRPLGWRIPAYSAGLMMVIFGLGSLLMGNQASSAGVLWGVLAIVWGVAFAAVAEWRSRSAV